MAKYIDVESLVVGYSGHTPDDDFSKGVDFVLDLLDSKSPADVRPVVRGKWEWRRRHRGGFRRVTGEDDFGVSHTITVDQRYVIDDPYCPFCGKLNESVFLNFCPNCGADMMDETIVEAEG